MDNPLNSLILPTPEAPPSFRWAVVTAVSPLAVRIESESDPLNGKPSTLVAGLEVNDRVFLVIAKNRATILGRAGG